MPHHAASPVVSMLKRGRPGQTARLAIAGAAMLALTAGILAVPPSSAHADPSVHFPFPDHWIDPTYEDVLGTHVSSTTPTIRITTWDEVEPAEGYVEYSAEIEIAPDTSSPAVATATMALARDSAWSEASYVVPADLLEFGREYSLRYRLLGGGEQGDWVEWRQFHMTEPSAAPTLVSPADGAVTTVADWLVAHVPNFSQSEMLWDSVTFTIESGWEFGAPFIRQLQAGIGADGTARIQMPSSLDVGQYRWTAQWVGSGYSQPSEYQEFAISKKAPTPQSVWVTTGQSSATVNYRVLPPAFAPIQYVDVVVAPGGYSQRVLAGDPPATFSNLPVGDYVATVTATNALGTSAAASASFEISPTVPASPESLIATVSETTVRATWNAPTYAGTSPIERYLVSMRSSDGGVEYQSFYTTGLFAEFPVELGHEYDLYVQAENEVGLGGFAGTRVVVVGPPSEPQNLDYLPGDEFVNFYFDAPLNDGGAFVSKYRVNVKDVGTYTVTAIYGRMGIQLNNLENGRPYTVTVRAISDAGLGAVAKLANVIAVSRDADTDSDGLPDVVETRFGTSSSLPDTDNDGISDVNETLELSAFLSPTVADTDADGVIDADEDSDEDGVGNAVEIAAGTNPAAPDTDHDGLADVIEIGGPSSPVLADTDADGIDDASELMLGLDPTLADTNGDGALDGDAIASQTLVEAEEYLPSPDDHDEWEKIVTPQFAGASADVTAPAGRLDDIIVATSPADDIVGAVTAVAEVIDAQSLLAAEEGNTASSLSPAAPSPVLATVAQLSFKYNANVSPDRLAELAPVVWNPSTYLWEFANNDVSISTATRTISILSPSLNLRYAVVDLRSWRAYINECDNGSTGRPQLDVEFIIDQLPSVKLHDQTKERFAAARAVLDSLAPGDTAAIREFGLSGISYGGGWGDGAGSWEFSSNLPTQSLSDEESFGLNSIERVGALLTKLEQHGGPSANDGPLSVGWDPEGVLFESRPDPITNPNPYVPKAAPLICRKSVIVLITDGGIQGDEIAWPGRVVPDEPFSTAGVPVHVLDVGAGDPEQTEWMIELSEETDGSYSYVPTSADLSGWIEDVAPLDWAQGDPNKDTDGDTIPDMVETYGIFSTLDKTDLGFRNYFYSNPRKADSDGDLIPDNVEIGQRLEIGTQGAAWTYSTINRNYWIVSDPGSKDGDLDGLTDRAELDLGGAPLAYDSDGDGLGDGSEEAFGTYSKQYDSDDDGFSDAFEVYSRDDGYNPTTFTEPISKYEWLSEFALGFFCGDVEDCQLNTIPWFLGSVSSGLLVFGDVRDAVANVAKGDYVSAAFCAVAVIPGYGDLTSFLSKAERFLLRIPDARHLADPSTADVLLRRLSLMNGTVKQLIEMVDDVMPEAVSALRMRYGLTDKAIISLTMNNGVDRMSAYALLDSQDTHVYTYTDATKPRYLDSDHAGEQALIKLNPAIAGYIQTRDVIGSKSRYWDGKYTVGSERHYVDAKVGHAASINRLVQLITDTKYKASHPGVYDWHFYASKDSCKIGPSILMLDVMLSEGITPVFHFPQGACSRT